MIISVIKKRVKNHPLPNGEGKEVRRLPQASAGLVQKPVDSIAVSLFVQGAPKKTIHSVL